MTSLDPKAIHIILLVVGLVSAVGSVLSQSFPGAPWLVYVTSAVSVATLLRTLLAPSVSTSVNQAAALAAAAKGTK